MCKLYAHKSSLIRYASKNKIQQQHHNKSEKNKVTISRVLKHNEAHNKFNLIYWIIIGISAENHLNDNKIYIYQIRMPANIVAIILPPKQYFSLSGFFMFLLCYVASKLRVYLYRCWSRTIFQCSVLPLNYLSNKEFPFYFINVFLIFRGSLKLPLLMLGI